MASWYDPFGVTDMFGGGGYKNPANAASPYLNQIPGTISPYYQPYVNAGQQALPTLQNQFNTMATNPGQSVNTIGQSFQQSPGYDWQVQQALQGSNQAAAAGGMAGSPQHEQQNMQLANNIANQDYYNWLSNALQQQNTGLSGLQNINTMGYGASNELAQSLANNLMGQAGMQVAGTAGKNMYNQGNLGMLLGAGVSALPYLMI